MALLGLLSMVRRARCLRLSGLLTLGVISLGLLAVGLIVVRRLSVLDSRFLSLGVVLSLGLRVWLLLVRRGRRGRRRTFLALRVVSLWLITMGLVTVGLVIVRRRGVAVLGSLSGRFLALGVSLSLWLRVRLLLVGRRRRGRSRVFLTLRVSLSLWLWVWLLLVRRRRGRGRVFLTLGVIAMRLSIMGLVAVRRLAMLRHGGLLALGMVAMALVRVIVMLLVLRVVRSSDFTLGVISLRMSLVVRLGWARLLNAVGFRRNRSSADEAGDHQGREENRNLHLG